MALSIETIHGYADVCTPNTETGSLNYIAFARAIEAEVRKHDEAQKVLNAVHDRHQLSGEERSMLEDLRDRGFAVCVFNPDEIRDADPESVEERMCAAGWDAIGGPWE